MRLWKGTELKTSMFYVTESRKSNCDGEQVAALRFWILKITTLCCFPIAAFCAVHKPNYHTAKQCLPLSGVALLFCYCMLRDGRGLEVTAIRLWRPNTASVVQWLEFLATDPEIQVRFPALPHFLRSSGSGTGSAQPREYSWGAAWKKK
jgi:hypothetical protein